MKKAFEQNVSRAKPRLRLGAFTGRRRGLARDTFCSKAFFMGGT